MGKQYYDEYDDEEYYEDERSDLETLLVTLLLLPFALVVWTLSIPFMGVGIASRSHVLGLYRDRLHPKYPHGHRD